MLTCNRRYGETRWLKYDPEKEGNKYCIVYGTVSSGETAYVARTHRSTDLIDALVPGLFVPSDGFMSVYWNFIEHSTDLEILCKAVKY